MQCFLIVFPVLSCTMCQDVCHASLYPYLIPVPKTFPRILNNENQFLIWNMVRFSILLTLTPYEKYCSRVFPTLEIKFSLIKPENDLGFQPEPYSRNFLHRYWIPGESKYQLNFWKYSRLITNSKIRRAKIIKDLGALYFNNIFISDFYEFCRYFRSSKFIQTFSRNNRKQSEE